MPTDHELKRAAREWVARVEVFLRIWDPIGVAPGEFGPADEYDSYAPAIVSLLLKGAAAKDIEEYLSEVCTVNMGLPRQVRRDRSTARAIVEWWGTQRDR